MDLPPRAARRLYPAALLLCSAAALAPIWSASYLPMVDLPQHLAQASIWMHLDDPRWGFTEQFRLNFGTPYLLGAALMRGLAELTSLEVAARLVSSLIVVGGALATDRLLRAAGGDRWWSLAALPAAYNFCWHWGFLPFLIAVPLGILLVAAAYWYSEAPSPRRAAALAALALALVPGHAIALGIALVCAFVIIAGRAPTWRQALVRALPLGAPVPLLLGWMVVSHGTERETHSGVQWGLDPLRVVDLPSMILGLPPDVSRDVPRTLDLVALAVLLALVALALLAGARLRRGVAYLGPAVVAILLYLLAPQAVFGGSFVYQRAAAFVLPLLLVAFTATAGGRRRAATRAGLVVVVLACMSVWLVRYRAFDEEVGRFDRILAATESNRRIVTAPWRYYSAAVPGAPFYLHFGAYYQATRGGVLGASFATAYAQLVRYRPGAEPPMTPGLQWLGDAFDWSVDGWYDYFLTRADADMGPRLFREATEPIVLVAHEGSWWLYAKAAGRGPTDAGARP